MNRKKQNLILIISLVIIVSIGVFYFKNDTSSTKETIQKEEKHIHKLEKKIDQKTGEVVYTCPMHPSVISNKPSNCPICGMKLVKKQKSNEATSEEQKDLKRVSLSPTQQILTNVATSSVKEINLDKEIITIGKITYDETKVYHVTSLIDGRVEKIYSNYTGSLTIKNTKMIDIYSPELVATQEEYLQAYDFSQKFKNNEFSDIADSSFSLLKAARKRLLLWDISESQIKELEKTKKPKINMTIYAPETGVLMKKNIEEGHFIKRGNMLFDIVDLSKVWMEADVYEYQLNQVKIGQKVDITTDAYPGEKFTGEINFIHPFLDPSTRTVKVRAEFNNLKLRLKPEMFVNVSIKVNLGKSLVIPKTAVLITGKRKIVWIEKEKGLYIPKEIKLGQATDNYYVVLNGLDKNEKVVSSAGFLIDSESQLKSITDSLPTDNSNLENNTIQSNNNQKIINESIDFSKELNKSKNNHSSDNDMDMSDMNMDNLEIQ